MDQTKDMIRNSGIERLGRFYSFYKGVVISRDDPDEGNRGRVKVSVPALFKGLEVWALPLSQIGSNNYGAKFLTPVVGETVFVYFRMGDPSKAFWSYSHWATGKVPSELQDPDTLGYVTPQNNQFILSDKEGKLTLRVGTFAGEDSTQVIVDNGTVSIEVGDEDDKTTVIIDHGKVTINGGQNMGLVNLPSLQKALLAIQQDLIVAQSGTQITQWYAAEDGYAALEDSNITH